MHDDEVAYLDATVDETTGAVTFKTNKFSVYAVLYSANVAVKFDANGGKWSDETIQKTVNTGTGLTVKAPEDPSNKCHKFEGWYKEAACTNKFDFTTTLDEDLTLYAKWSEEVHTWDEGKVTEETTCTEKGEKTLTCTVCGATKTEEIAATGHKLVDHPRVDPTATEEGTEEYWECSVCGFFFSDAEGKNVISNPIVIPPTGKTDDGKKDDSKKDDSSAKKDDSKKDNSSTKKTDNKNSSSKNNKAIPQTGDATNVAAMVSAVLVGISLVCGGFALKKH